MAAGPRLNTLTPGMVLEGVYLLLRSDLGTTKNGKSYGNLVLGDPSGQMDGRVWDRAEELLGEVDSGALVLVKGRVESFRGQNQAVVEDLAPAGDSGDPAEFLPASPVPPAELSRRLDKLLAGIKEPNLKKALNAFFGDDDFRRDFSRAPAAKFAHHAYVGGLLEHTVSVAGLAREVAGRYPELDRDLLVVGALLHDVGKVEELTLGPPLGYSDAGRLLGHLVLGLRMLDERLGRLKKFPAPLADHLRHFIASHHGQEAFGSPVKPKTREAMVLHMLDDLDAKLAMAGEALAADQEPGNWTRFHRLLERHLYTGPDPLGKTVGKDQEGPEPADRSEPDRSTPSLFGD